MADPNAAGKDTTEYKVAKWTTIICGVTVPILGSVSAFVASQPDPSEGGMVALAMTMAAVTGVAGWANKIYNAGRTGLKVAKVNAGALAQAVAANPQLLAQLFRSESGLSQLMPLPGSLVMDPSTSASDSTPE